MTKNSKVHVNYVLIPCKADMTYISISIIPAINTAQKKFKICMHIKIIDVILCYVSKTLYMIIRFFFLPIQSCVFSHLKYRSRSEKTEQKSCEIQCPSVDFWESSVACWHFQRFFISYKKTNIPYCRQLEESDLIIFPDNSTMRQWFPN